MMMGHEPFVETMSSLIAIHLKMYVIENRMNLIVLPEGTELESMYRILHICISGLENKRRAFPDKFEKLQGNITEPLHNTQSTYISVR